MAICPSFFLSIQNCCFRHLRGYTSDLSLFLGFRSWICWTFLWTFVMLSPFSLPLSPWRVLIRQPFHPLDIFSCPSVAFSKLIPSFSEASILSKVTRPFSTQDEDRARFYTVTKWSTLSCFSYPSWMTPDDLLAFLADTACLSHWFQRTASWWFQYPSLKL